MVLAKFWCRKNVLQYDDYNDKKLYERMEHHVDREITTALSSI